MSLEQPYRYKIFPFSMSEILIFDVFFPYSFAGLTFVRRAVANFHVCPTVCNFTELRGH